MTARRVIQSRDTTTHVAQLNANVLDCAIAKHVLTPKLALISVGEGGRTCQREHQHRWQGRVVGSRSEQLHIEWKSEISEVMILELGQNLEHLQSMINSREGNRDCVLGKIKGTCGFQASLGSPARSIQFHL